MLEQDKLSYVRLQQVSSGYIRLGHVKSC